MIPIADYHMHTPLCGHAIGQPQEYAHQALKAGLSEIGFSDHAPLLCYDDPKITMNIKQLPQYHRMIEDVRTQYKGKLNIKVAIEADFLSGLEEKTRSLLQGYPYDYVIGSVHFIKDWGFDDPSKLNEWQSKNVDEVYHLYYELLRKSAESRLFDIMGHVDLVKKFGHRASEDLTAEIEKTAKVFKKAEVAVEINTSGLRKPVKEIYPALAALKIYCKAGVPLTFGSDAHAPADVGADFDKAIDLAKAAGYKQCVLFRQRKIEQMVRI